VSVEESVLSHIAHGYVRIAVGEFWRKDARRSRDAVISTKVDVVILETDTQIISSRGNLLDATD
jgi:hypothetical protein